jgi:hypothetical protein
MRRRGRLIARSSPVAARREHRWSGAALPGEPVGGAAPVTPIRGAGGAGAGSRVARRGAVVEPGDAGPAPGRVAPDELRRRALRMARARRLALTWRVSVGARS